MADTRPDDPDQLLAMFDGLDELVEADAAWNAAPLPRVDVAAAAPLADATAAPHEHEELGWSVVPDGPPVEIVVDSPPARAERAPAHHAPPPRLSVERRAFPDAPPKGTGNVGRVRGTTAQVLASFRWES